MFAVIDKYAGIEVHMEKMKIRLLNSKVKAEFLVSTKTDIDMQMHMVPMAMNYAPALVNDRNTLNQNITDTSINNTRTLRRVQHTNTGRIGRIISGRGGRGWGGKGSGRRNNEWQVIGIDSTTIQVYPANLFEHE